MGENWSLSQEEEDLHRQGLFRKARKPSRSYRKPTACDSGPSRNVQSWSMTLLKVGNRKKRENPYRKNTTPSNPLSHRTR